MGPEIDPEVVDAARAVCKDEVSHKNLLKRFSDQRTVVFGPRVYGIHNAFQKRNKLKELDILHTSVKMCGN